MSKHCQECSFYCYDDNKCTKNHKVSKDAQEIFNKIKYEHAPIYFHKSKCSDYEFDHLGMKFINADEDDINEPCNDTSCNCNEENGFFCHICNAEISEDIHDDNDGICDDCWSENDGNPESSDITNHVEDLGYPS